MSFDIPIKVDATGALAGIKQVEGALSKVEHAGGAAGATVTKGMREGSVATEKLAAEARMAGASVRDIEKSAAGLGPALKQSFGGLGTDLKGMFSGMTDVMSGIGMVKQAVGTITDMHDALVLQ